ncbi:MAG: VOC family protein, partial [Bacilli bacterium]
VIQKMQPQLNFGTPSLLFYADDFEDLHARLKGNGVTVGDIIPMPFGRTFNFCDVEENYFAVLEK